MRSNTNFDKEGPNMDRITATRISLAAHHYNDLKLQIPPEAAMAHTVQRFDVNPRDVRVLACHEARLPTEHDLEGSNAW